VQGRNGNSVAEAKTFAAKIGAIAARAIDWWQPPLLLTEARS
jgi:hypothetical protein